MDVRLLCMFCVTRQRCASGWSLVQRSPTERVVSECDREASIMRRPWPTRGCCATEEKCIILYMSYVHAKYVRSQNDAVQYVCSCVVAHSVL